jgi:lipopolysaccharide export system permease protein
MSILQRYTLRELLGPLGLGLLVFTFIFLIGQIFKLTELLFNEGVPAYLAGELILSLLPNIISMTLPMAVLVSILLGIGRLAADREILAIRTSGVNLLHICLPVLGLAMLISAGMIWANLRLVPYLNLKSEDLATQILFKSISALPADRVNKLEGGKGKPTSLFFFDSKDSKTNELHNVNIKTVQEPKGESSKETEFRKTFREQLSKLSKKKDKASKAQRDALLQRARRAEQNRKIQQSLIVAERGHIEASIADRLVTINLTSGSMHMINPDRPASYNVVNFATFQRGLRPQIGDSDTGELKRSAREMSLSELHSKMKSDKKISRYGVEYFQRFSIPLACIAFALIAIPLAVYVKPTGKAIAFAISFLLILLYYGLMQYGVSLGRTGSSFAPFAIFFPNLLLSAVGSLLLYRMVMR